MPTRDAVAVAVLAALLLFVALNLQAGWVYAVDALLMGLLIVGWISARISVRGLAVQRSMPVEAFEGEEVSVTLTVAASRWTRHLLLLRDAVPGLGLTHLSVPVVSPQAATVAYRAPARRRGYHTVETVEVSSGGLTGLFVAGARPRAPGALLVYPRYWVLRQFLLPGRTDQYADVLLRATRTGLEFAGVRDFRDGDTLRHVHWRSTARRGTLVVREFEEELFPAATLLLDTRAGVHTGTEDDNTFEDLIRAAASIAHFVTSAAQPVRLIHSEGREAKALTGGWKETLGVLARIRATGALSPDEVYRSTQQAGTPVVLLTPDVESATALAQQGIPLTLVAAEARSDRPRSIPRIPNVPIYVLRRGEEVGVCLDASPS